jgi:uncharacterized pyridoxamine 5'-phosphate oxidase family protein
MQEAYEFLNKAGTYWLATTEGDQARVRPFGTVLIHDGKLYFQTGKSKPVSKQMAANPKVELGASNGGDWIRVAATAVNDDSVEVKTKMLEAYPFLKNNYAADDDNTQVLYLKNATATFSSFSGDDRVVTF